MPPSPATPPSGSSALQNQEARVVVESLDGSRVVVSVPGTEYRLHLVPGAPASAFPTRPHARATGSVRGRALRMHRAAAGGVFIEPIEGHPRILQGRVLEVDAAGRRLLLHAVIPMWMDLAEGQSAEEFQAGDLVNFYAERGVTFTPTA